MMSKTEKHIEYWSYGQKRNEGTLKDGEQDGKWTWWYANGQKKKEGTLKDGIQIGKSESWLEDGSVAVDLSKCNYKSAGGFAKKRAEYAWVGGGELISIGLESPKNATSWRFLCYFYDRFGIQKAMTIDIGCSNASYSVIDVQVF